jgi:hypothetical protein
VFVLQLRHPQASAALQPNVSAGRRRRRTY